MPRITQQQLEDIQIDYGIIYTNYGEVDSARLGVTKGGGNFIATQEGHYIEFDGATGKEKGTYVIDTILASLTTTVKNLSQEVIMLALPYATITSDVITVGRANVGVVQSNAYLKNVTMFAKTIKGEYKKITLYNAMNLTGLNFVAAPKVEGEYVLTFDGHLNPELATDMDLLYKIEDVLTIGDDVL